MRAGHTSRKTSKQNLELTRASSRSPRHAQTTAAIRTVWYDRDGRQAQVPGLMPSRKSAISTSSKGWAASQEARHTPAFWPAQPTVKKRKTRRQFHCMDCFAPRMNTYRRYGHLCELRSSNAYAAATAVTQVNSRFVTIARIQLQNHDRSCSAT